MKTALAIIILTAAFMPTVAHANCPAKLTWRDATYIKAEHTKAGKVIEAELIKYADAVRTRMNNRGEQATVLALSGPHFPKISFTRADTPMPPMMLGEIGMVLAPPMADGSWPRFRTPCDVKEGLDLTFSAADIPEWNVADRGTVQGTMRRDGMRIVYTMSWTRNGKEKSVRGVWEFNNQLPSVPLTLDLRGWSVYRDNLLVKSLNADVPQPLGEVLVRLRSGTP